MDQPAYTTVLHDARLKLGLNIEEYCVADIIYHLSKNFGNKANGWCYASKEKVAEYLGIGKRTVFRHIQKLITLNLVEKHPDITSNLRTTETWYTNVIIRPRQNGTVYAKMAHEPRQNGTPNSAKMAHYNNIYNNKITPSTEGEKTISSQRFSEIKRDIYKKIGKLPM